MNNNLCTNNLCTDDLSNKNSIDMTNTSGIAGLYIANTDVDTSVFDITPTATVGAVSSLQWTTTYPTYSYNNTIATSAYNSLTTLFGLLTEDEIDDVLSKAKERSLKEDFDSFSNIISELVKCRHFSEDFLIKYSLYFSKFDAFIMHKSDIVTGQYPRLALLYELDK